MKGIRRLGLIGVALLVLMLGFVPLAKGQLVLPGANYVGDSDNSMIDTPDFDAILSFLATGSASCWPVPPENRERTA